MVQEIFQEEAESICQLASLPIIESEMAGHGLNIGRSNFSV
jgi:hypothetical protein